MKPLDHRVLDDASEIWSADLAFGDGRRLSRAEFEALLEAIPQMAWAHFPGEAHREYYNRHWSGFVGTELSPDGSTRRSLIHEEDRVQALRAWADALESGTPYEAYYRLRHHSGEYRWIRSCGVAQRSARGVILCWIGTCTDVDDLVRARAALSASEAVNRSILEGSADSIKLLNGDGEIVFANQAAAAHMSGHGIDCPVGRSWIATFPSVSRGLAQSALAAAQSGEPARFTSLRYAEGGDPEWRDFVLSPVSRSDGAIDGVVVSARDVTPERLAKERLRWASTHDALTQLPNRNFFQECLQEALRQADRAGEGVALLLLDIASLKQINDAIGYSAGDDLLSAFAERLRTSVGDRNVIGRLGGDEFGIILGGLPRDADIGPATEQIQRSLADPFELEGRLVDCRSRMGASIYPSGGRHVADLMKQAHIALYAAKQGGRSGCAIFEPAMRAGMQNRISMLALTRDALRDDRIEPFYQPKIDLRTRAVSGFEALFRWRDVRGRVHPPGTVFAAFEDSELAPQVTQRILDRVTVDVRRWLDEGVPFGHVAVNASGPDFRSGGFADRLLDRLERAAIPPSHLQLEVTETVFLGRGARHVEAALRQLSEAGVRIALDDFGTGYASLTHLKSFPVSVLKLDRSFVADLGSDAGSDAIVRAVVGLGKSLGLQTVAEGVERIEQEEFLLGCGCDQVQGFFYWRPVEAAGVPEIVRRSALRARRKAAPPRLEVVGNNSASN